MTTGNKQLPLFHLHSVNVLVFYFFKLNNRIHNLLALTIIWRQCGRSDTKAYKGVRTSAYPTPSDFPVLFHCISRFHSLASSLVPLVDVSYFVLTIKKKEHETTYSFHPCFVFRTFVNKFENVEAAWGEFRILTGVSSQSWGCGGTVHASPPLRCVGKSLLSSEQCPS